MIEILNFIFKIGVVLAVYNFLWWFISMGVSILRGGRPNNVFGVYFLRAIRYLFLMDVIFLFTIHRKGEIILNDFLIAGLIALIYFVGKLQNNQEKQQLFKVTTNISFHGINDFIKKINPPYNLKLEIGVIVLAMGLYVLFFFQQDWAYNAISNWFLDSILNIEDTPIFGFIFKVIGFLFLLNVLVKLIKGLLLPIVSAKQNNNDKDDFDDYTEVR